MKVLEKIKKEVKDASKVKDTKKPEVKDAKKPEVKDAKPVVKDTKPKSMSDTFDSYHIETGSLASQVIAYILECNRKEKPITMKDIKNKFGNTFYSIFCRLEERKLAHREGKFLYVHEIGHDKIAKLVLPIIKTRVGANDQIKADEQSKIEKLLSSQIKS